MKPLDWILLGVIAVAVIAALVYWLTHRSCSCGSGSCSGNCANCKAACKKTAQEIEKEDLTGSTVTKADKTEVLPEKTIPQEPKETVSFEVLDTSMEETDPEQSRTTEEYTNWLQEQNAVESVTKQTESTNATETPDEPAAEQASATEIAD